MMTDALAQFRTARLVNAFRERQGSDCTECSDADEKPTTAAPVTEDIVIHGLAVPYDTPTGDGRQIRSGALTWDLAESSIPIIWDREDGDHTGMTVGRVDSLRADDSGVYVERARLFATDDEIAGAAVSRLAELISEGAIGWSAGLDNETVEISFRESAQPVEGDDGTVTVTMSRSDEMATVLSAGFRHLAIVDTPAFAGARPVLGEAPVNAAVAAVATYPRAHFERWESPTPVPLQVTPDGRIFGHVAGDGCYRTGPTPSNVCRKYTADPDPRMENFHTGTATLDDGSVVRVGSLTAGSLHATPAGPIDLQRQHHENSSTVFAKVRAWNDAMGRLCVSGSIVPGLDPTFVAQAAGQPASVELWPVAGVSGLTLAGIQIVNNPAWPVK